MSNFQNPSMYKGTDTEIEIRRSRYAIFEKNANFGVIGLAITAEHNVVGQNDPRCDNRPFKYKSFETEQEASHWFNEYVIATVSENGWKLLYSGDRNIG